MKADTDTKNAYDEFIHCWCASFPDFMLNRSSSFTSISLCRKTRYNPDFDSYDELVYRLYVKVLERRLPGPCYGTASCPLSLMLPPWRGPPALFSWVGKLIWIPRKDRKMGNDRKRKASNAPLRQIRKVQKVRMVKKGREANS